MRTLRTLAAVVAVAAVTLGGAVPPDFDVTPTSLECNTATGSWETGVVVTNNLSEDAGVSGTYAWETFDGAVGGGPLAFEPPTLPADGVTLAEVTVPGTVAHIDFDLLIEYPDSEDPAHLDLEFITTCEVEPTTTTTEAPPPAPRPARVQPTFTG